MNGYIIQYAIILIMSIFKKRKENKRIGFSKVYMPKKPTVNPVLERKKRKKTIFKKNKTQYRGKVKLSLGLQRGVLILFLVVLLLGFLYLTFIFVTRIRQTTSTSDMKTEKVVGIGDIPSYPNSLFIFKDQMKDEIVARFVSKGNSAYRLPVGTKISDVYEYYNEKLPELGWTFSISVPFGSETMKDGEYWIKEEKGLRIYSKFNDVWYESISVKDAQEGLAERVKQETERDLLLAKEDLQDLLPDFPWILQVPREYVISYSVSQFKDHRLMLLRKLGGEEKIQLIPIDSYDGQALDYFLHKYIEQVNSNGEELKCSITRTELAYTEFTKGIKGKITCSDGVHDIAVLVEPNRGIGYVLDGNPENNPFFETVFSNLQPQESRKLR